MKFAILGVCILAQMLIPQHQAFAQTDGEANSQPNIVFIFADDQSPKTIGAHGNPHIKTPNLDKLARRGVSFTSAHNMGAWNGAVCLASRAMLNSGRAVWDAYALEESFAAGQGLDGTWGRLMQQQGYDTYMTGKWHVVYPPEKVFQTTRHVRPGMPPDAWTHGGVHQKFVDLAAGRGRYKSAAEFIPVGYNRPLSESDNSWSPTDPRFGGYYEGGTHWSEVLKQDALRFIEQSQQSDNPFFMYIAFNAPHDPRQAPQEYQDLYDAESLPLPGSWQPEYPEKDRIGNGPSLRDAALAPFPRTHYATRVHLKEYYAIISHLDTQVGEIIAALEAAGTIDNTVIIYTADHGLAVGEHGLFGKQNMYEHSVRVPFIVAGPNMPEGLSVGADIYLQDAMATALDLAGANKPDHVFFNSVVPLATGATTNSAYDAVYGAYVRSQRMIKKDGFKLIVYPKANKLKLFDLENDSEEITNLAADPAHRGKVKELFTALLDLQESMNDELDLSDMYGAL